MSGHLLMNWWRVINKSWVPGLRFGDPGPRFGDSGLRFSEPGLRFSGPGLRFSDPGLRFGDPGLRFGDPGLVTKTGLITDQPRFLIPANKQAHLLPLFHPARYSRECRHLHKSFLQITRPSCSAAKCRTFAIRSLCPTVYCGITFFHRVTTANSGCFLIFIVLFISFNTMAVIS